jgi:hypothetical protein
LANVPENPKLWNLLLGQARAKHPSHGVGLSYPAAKFVRSEYERQGGAYVGSKEEVPLKNRDLKAEEEAKEKRKKSEEKRKNKARGFRN